MGKLLGRGAFGSVYEATFKSKYSDSNITDKYAIKIVTRTIVCCLICCRLKRLPLKMMQW